jgi:hypothetical protein
VAEAAGGRGGCEAGGPPLLDAPGESCEEGGGGWIMRENGRRKRKKGMGSNGKERKKIKEG